MQSQGPGASPGSSPGDNPGRATDRKSKSREKPYWLGDSEGCWGRPPEAAKDQGVLWRGEL